MDSHSGCSPFESFLLLAASQFPVENKFALQRFCLVCHCFWQAEKHQTVHHSYMSEHPMYQIFSLKKHTTTLNKLYITPSFQCHLHAKVETSPTFGVQFVTQ